MKEMLNLEIYYNGCHSNARSMRDFRGIKLSSSIMDFIISVISSGELETLECLGITNDTALKLKSVSHGALNRVVSDRPAPFFIGVNEKKLSLFIDKAVNEEMQSRLIDRSIRLGIRQGQLNQLTGVSRREFDARRIGMGLPDIPPGRIMALEDRASASLYRIIDNVVPKDESGVFVFSLETLCEVAEETGFSISTIWVETISSKETFFSSKFKII